MERRKRIGWIVGMIGLAALAGGAYWALSPRPAAKPAPRPAANLPPGTEIQLAATLRASSVTAVAAPIDGQIESVLVEPGQPVYEGQPLGRIANSSLDEDQQLAASDLDRAQALVSQLETETIGARADASSARAEAVRTRSESDRLEKDYLHQQLLYKEGAAPRLTFEKAAAEFEAARRARDTRAEAAQAAEQRSAALAKSLEAARQALAEKQEALDAARENAAAADILSPADGLLVAAHRPGEHVTTAVHDLFQIAVNLAALEAVAEAPPDVTVRIRVGQDAVVSIDGTPQALPGKVKSAEGTVVVEFVNPYPSVQPGGAALVRLKLP